MSIDVEILSNYHVAIIIANSDNLYSSICDAVNLIHLYNTFFNMMQIYVITNNIGSKNIILNKIKLFELKESCKIDVKSNDGILDLGKLIESIDDNFVLTLSSHGYAHGDKNYFVWNGITIHDYELHLWIVNNMKNHLSCFAMIDTCQSGTMLNLNYKTKDLISYYPENLSDCVLDIICIGAVDDNEYDQDDISDYGYGGGLSCSFIDFINEHIGKNIGEFFIYYKNRISTVGHHPILSINVQPSNKK